MGKQMRDDAERQLAVLRVGYQKRLDMIEAVKNRKNEKSAALASLDAQVKELETEKEQYTQAKEAAEEPEQAAIYKHKKAWESFKKEQEELRERSAAEEAYRFFAPDNSTLQSETLLTKLVKEGESLSEDIQEFLKGLTEVNVESFVGEVWPKIKTVFRALEKNSGTPPPPEVPVSDDEDKHDDEKHDHLLDPYDEEERAGDDEHDDADKNTAIALDQDRIPDYDQETKSLIAAAEKARKEYTDFDLKLFNVNEEKKAVQKWLENDYGPEYVFAALENNCYEYTDREYTYKFCAFDKVNQKPKDGGSETGLGKWGNWESDYKVMKYVDGARCWNGPSRSTKIRLTCGAENQLVSASEPSRCEYEMEFQTPTVCSEPPQNVSAHLGIHDEL